MKVEVGDRIVFEATHVGEARRTAVVLEVRHADGSPPYLVRWLDNEHEGLVFPGSDARLERPAA